MARGLVVRIFDELFAMEALKAGDVCIDPFTGIGSTGIESASRGVRFVGCELEPKFVELARQNFELHRRDWEATGRPQPVCVQGDSRNLRAVLGPAGTPLQPNERSRPEAKIDRLIAEGKHREAEIVRQHLSGAHNNLRQQDYGRADGQLGQMPEGCVAAVVSSPPYSTGDSASAQSIEDRTDKSATWIKQRFKATGHAALTKGYGKSKGQLGVMPAGAVADAIVSSPPYESSLTQGNHPENYDYTQYGGRGQLANAQRYGQSDGQLGNDTGETFWAASAIILRECLAILKPGGVAVWVVKHFVRKGQLVDFPGDWRRLCEHVGFETVTEVHAMLTHEEEVPHLFDGTRTKRTERKSFFRRLAEKKGSPRIDYETVLFLRKRKVTT